MAERDDVDDLEDVDLERDDVQALERGRLELPDSSNTEDEPTEWVIYIKSITGKINNFHVPPDCPVDVLGKQVAEYFASDMEAIRLMHDGKQLEYGKTKRLTEYGIGNRSTVFVLLRLRGGLMM